VISSGHHAIAIGYRFLMAVPVDSFLLFTFQKKNLFFIHLQFPIKAAPTVQQLRLSFFKSMQLPRSVHLLNAIEPCCRVGSVAMATRKKIEHPPSTAALIYL
jgi:hypothetical protein